MAALQGVTVDVPHGSLELGGVTTPMARLTLAVTARKREVPLLPVVAPRVGEGTMGPMVKSPLAYRGVQNLHRT